MNASRIPWRFMIAKLVASTAESMRFHVEGSQASIFLDEVLSAGSVREVITLARLVSLWRIGEALTGRQIHGSAEVAFAEPRYYARFAHFAPPVRFDRPATRARRSGSAARNPYLTCEMIPWRTAPTTRALKTVA